MLASNSAHGAPTFIDLPADHGRHSAAAAELWYVASVVRSGETEFGVVVIFLAFPDPGGMHVVVSAVNRETGQRVSRTISAEVGEMSVSADSLNVRTPSASLVGDVSHFELSVELPGATIALQLSGAAVLHNAGTGLWPWVPGTTHQVSFPGVEARGILALDGKAYEVAGSSWYDRQWFSVFEFPEVFQWVGLCLDNGDALSVFYLAGAGDTRSFATCLRADGTHLVAPVPSVRDAFSVPVARGGTDADPDLYRLVLPALDADLLLAGYDIHESREGGGTSRTSVLAVNGTYQGQPASGYGFTDIALRSSS